MDTSETVYISSLALLKVGNSDSLEFGPDFAGGAYVQRIDSIWVVHRGLTYHMGSAQRVNIAYA